jgi:hypothetical protein
MDFLTSQDQPPEQDTRVVYIFDNEYFSTNGFGRGNPVRGLGSGDSMLFLNVLPEEIADGSFERLNDEIDWKSMNHKGSEVPRLISIQGDLNRDGSQPLYRHPADEQPTLVSWTPFAQQCRDIVSELLDQPLNHALIQKYRSGRDNIGEHADKTLDIAKGRYYLVSPIHRLNPT